MKRYRFFKMLALLLAMALLTSLAVYADATRNEDAKITPPQGTDAWTDFGWAADIDGDTMVVGAEFDNDQGTSAGALYVYTLIDGKWTFQQKLYASDPTRSDNFGHSVAINGDTLVAGALWADATAGSSSGAAYVFTRVDGNWVQQAKLTASDTASPRFGDTVAIDGDTVMVGCESAAKAYVFSRSEGGWSEEAKLTEGHRVALSGDIAILGSPSESVDSVRAAGAAYVFTRSEGSWTLWDRLTASDFASSDGFGYRVAAFADTVVVGSGRAEAAYVFTPSGSGWNEVILTASDSPPGASFGTSVAISGDTVVIGAPEQDDGAGSAYVFNRQPDGAWAEMAKLQASDRVSWDYLAGEDSLGISNGKIVTGGGYWNSKDAIYVFEGFGAADSDGDGVTDDVDACPDTPAGEAVDANGCAQSQLDDDGDGVTNDIDACPGTPAGETVDANGCSASQLDDDGDGVTNDIDAYPQSDMKATVCIGDCDSTVPNRVLDNGATFMDLINTAQADPETHGDFVSAVSHLANEWKDAGLISGKDKGKITSCAAHSDTPAEKPGKGNSKEANRSDEPLFTNFLFLPAVNR